MTKKHSAFRVSLAFALACTMVGNSIPAPALAQMIEDSQQQVAAQETSEWEGDALEAIEAGELYSVEEDEATEQLEDQGLEQTQEPEATQADEVQDENLDEDALKEGDTTDAQQTNDSDDAKADDAKADDAKAENADAITQQAAEEIRLAASAREFDDETTDQARLTITLLDAILANLAYEDEAIMLADPTAAATQYAEFAGTDESPALEYVRQLLGENPTTESVDEALCTLADELAIEHVGVTGANDARWTMLRVDDAWYHVDAIAAAKAIVERGDTNARDAAFAWLLVSDEAITVLDAERAPWHATTEGDELPLAETSYWQEELPETDLVEDETTTEVNDGEGEEADDPAATTAESDENAAKKAIEDCTITLSATRYVYDGTTKAPNVTVKDGSTTLKEDVDYTVSYAIGRKDVGTYAVTVTGIGSYEGTGKATFEITPKKVTPTIELSSDELVFTGKSQVPVVTAKIGSKTLRRGADYTVEFPSNAVDVNTYSLSVSLKKNYTGTASASYKIVPADMSQVKISKVDAQEYTGSEVKPTPVVKLNGVTLKNNKDYTISYNNNVNAGTAKVTFEAKSKNLTGEKATTCKITCACINGASVSAIGDKLYTGKYIQPKPVVKLSGRTLKLGRDYRLLYMNNKNVGTATVIVVGAGNYFGTVWKTFRIVKRLISKARVTGVKASYTYTGKAIAPNPTVKYGSTKLKKNTHYTVSYKNNTKAGTATITIKGKGTYGGTKTVKFKIARRSVAKASVSGVKASYNWTGKAIKPSPTVKVAGRTLKKNTDYKVSYKNNVNAGTATVVITGKGNYSGTKKVTFKIKKTKKYQLKRDTWNFVNLSDPIGEDVYTKMFGKSQGSVVRREDDGTMGQCYGMASSTGAIGINSPSVGTFYSGGRRASNLYQVGTGWTTSAKNMTAKKYIQYNHIAQYVKGIADEHSRNYENYSGLVSAIRKSVSGGTPIVIALYGGFGGHAVFPLAITSDSSSSTVISVYDSNYPTTAQTLTLYKSNGSYNRRFDYTGFIAWYISWSTPADNINTYMKGGQTSKFSSTLDAMAAGDDSVRYTLYTVDTNMKMTVGGKEYDLREDACFNDGVVVPVRGTTGNDGAQMYWVRDDAGEVTFDGMERDANITVAAKTGGVEVSVEAGSEVTTDVNNFSANGVEVSGDEGDEFSMRFFDDRGGAELDEVTVSGTVDGEGTVEAQQQGSEVVVDGATEVTEC